VRNVKGAGATGAGKSGCSFSFYDSNSSFFIPPHPSYLSVTPTSLRFPSSIFSCSRTQLHLRHITDFPSNPPFLSPIVQDILSLIAETDQEM
jgi:hypothetical protein